jgi:hypothetical protein
MRVVRRVVLAFGWLLLAGATDPRCAMVKTPTMPPPPPPPSPTEPAITVAPPRERPPEVPATYEEKRREHAPTRVAMKPPPPPPSPDRAVRRVTLPDEVVVRALGVGQSLFLRCFRKATADDPSLGRTKVRLHLELDARGKVTSARTDSDSAVLDQCLQRVGYMLPFPAPRKPAEVDIPLFLGS